MSRPTIPGTWRFVIPLAAALLGAPAYAQLCTLCPMFPRIVTVDADGNGDFVSFTDAIAFVSTQTRNSTSQWMVDVIPGQYPVTGTLVIPTWTHVACRARVTSIDASWGDDQPCMLYRTLGSTGDFIRLGDSSISGFLLDDWSSNCTTPCAMLDWASPGGFFSAADVTLHSTRENVIGVRMDSTLSDRLSLQDVKIILEGGTGTTGLVYSSAGPGWADDVLITTSGNGGGTAVEATGTGDLSLLGVTIESLWTTKVTDTGTGDLLIDGVTSDGAHLGTVRASPPQCQRMGNYYTDTSGAFCWCNGSTWLKVGGDASGTCS